MVLPKLRFKPGVVVDTLDVAVLPGLISLITIIQQVLPDTLEVWITSVNEGVHKSGSLHYEGRALDIRCKYWPDEAVIKIVAKFKEFYDADFDLVWEANGLPYEHLHLEYDPGNRNH